MEGYPQYLIAGGVDWFEWSGRIHWKLVDQFKRALALIAKAKDYAQAHKRRFEQIDLPEFGPVNVRRRGANKGGDRGQHFEYHLEVSGVAIGFSPRDIEPGLTGSKLKKTQPNFLASQTGRHSLLVGPREGFERADTLISALGGVSIKKQISRGDLCIDIPNLDVAELVALLLKNCFVTKSSRVLPVQDLVSGRMTGFHAGKHPLYMTVYDKLLQRLGKTDQLYNEALIQRRWGGTIPSTATRVEYQIGRAHFRECGIDTPEDFLERRGLLGHYLTHEWFRLTEGPVDRRNKHQSRAVVHPLWRGIQGGFADVFGPPEGTFGKLDREKVKPIELARQARGCLVSCLLQMNREFSTYREFVAACANVLWNLFPGEHERKYFLEEVAKRRMEHELP